MKNFTTLALVLSLIFVTAACKKGGEESSETTPSTTTVTTTTSTGDAASIGISECDEYINKYESCISSKVPESSRAPLKSALDQSRQQWKAAAADDNAKAALASGCKAAMDAARASMQAYGCEW